jgi:hypothetical protein
LPSSTPGGNASTEKRAWEATPGGNASTEKRAWEATPGGPGAAPGCGRNLRSPPINVRPWARQLSCVVAYPARQALTMAMTAAGVIALAAATSAVRSSCGTDARISAIRSAMAGDIG